MSLAPLAGMGILITRPRELAGPLIDGVAALGGTPVLYPAVEIGPPDDPLALDDAVNDLHLTDLAIFVSPTAIARALPRILARHGAWPAGCRAAAVGAGSARALVGFGVTPVLVSATGADSEHLLALPELHDVAGRRVVIFRGEGGRALLAEELAHRGASVRQAACYRRLPPTADPAPVLALWRAGGIQAVVVTSAELLRNLAQALGDAGNALLRGTPMLVGHDRVAEAARQLGIERVGVGGPGDAGLLAALTETLTHA